MEPKYKFFFFAVLFVITLGMVAIGLLTSYNLSKTYRRHYLQTLLYQQIFLYSFFIYGVWGRIFLGQVLSGFELSPAVLNKASLFIPAIGLPFLIVNWFMLIKFFYETKNLKITKTTTIIYFVFYVVLVTTGAWFINSGAFLKLDSPENTFLRLMAGLNFVSNLFILIPVFFLKSGPDENYNLRFHPVYVLVYLAGVFAYSVGIWFIKEHFLVAGLTILLMFSISVLIPVYAMILVKKLPVGENLGKMDFDSFCLKYEISKREAEIIHEICSGKSNQDIADSLFISLQTVKDHSHRIYTKIGVKNRVHLVNLVREKIKKR
jgi:DNA-binding CsgD family transcriptional regulator